MGLLASLLVGLGLDASSFNKGLDEAKKNAETSSSGIGGSLSKIGSVAKMGMGLAVGGIGMLTGAIAGAVSITGNWAEGIDNLGDTLGATPEQGAGLMVMMKSIGGDTEELTKQLVFMGKGLVDSAGELGPTGKELSALGVGVLDANGNLRSSVDIFGDVSTKLAEMPDGIEKTNLMMKIFGKSGKEMSDTMNAAANGGIQNATDKAKNLGLSLGTTGVEASKKMNKGLADLKLEGQGLATTFGSAILPKLTELLGSFNTFITTHGPQIQAIFSWLGNHAPLMLGLMGVAAVTFFALFVASSVPAIIAGWAVMAPFLPIIAIIALVLAAVVGLYLLWTNNFGGIRDIVEKVANIVSGLFHSAIQGACDLWNNTFKPALDKVLQIFKDIVGYIVDWIGPKITWLQTVFGNLAAALEGGVKSALNWLHEKLLAVANFLAGFHLPDWLTGHSPTPFEMGLRGIGRALADLSNYKLPEFSAKVNLSAKNPAMAFASVNASPGRFVNVTLDYRPIISFADEREAKERLIPYIRDALRNVK